MSSSSLPPDPWQVLGLTKSADKAEVRTAYKKLVLKCHPDKVQDPTLKAQKQDEFQRVQQAYELLNDDVEKAKYEDQVKLNDLRKRMAKPATTSATSRTPPVKHYSFDVRTPTDSKYKSSSSAAPTSSKIYTQSTSHSRSHEDTSRTYDFEIPIRSRSARRTDSTEYLKSSSRRDRDDDKRDRDRDRDRERERERERDRDRDERHRRREEEELRERDRLARKERSKRSDKERRQAVEDKSRRYREPYVEKLPDDLVEEVYVSKTEKKKSTSSKKHDEVRGRDRSVLREDRRESSKIEPRKQRTNDYIEYAANYIERTKSKASQSPSSSFPESYSGYPTVPVTVPMPPAVDPYEDESIRRSAARAARRSSNDMPKKERSSSRRQPSREEFDIVDTVPRMPSLAKSHSVPLSQMVSNSPPRVSRSNTTDTYSRAPLQAPSFGRSQSWAVGEDDRTGGRSSYVIAEPLYESEHEEEMPRRSHRSRRSPETMRYRVGDDNKTSKIDGQYAYAESPPTRRHTGGLGRSSSTMYGSEYKVKTSPAYGVEDVKFSDVQHSASPYTYRPDLSAY